MIEYQAIAGSSTYHQTLANDERKGIFPFSATLDKSCKIILLFPSIIAPHLPAFPCFYSVPFFFHRSAPFFTSSFRNDVRNFARCYISII